MFYDSFLQELAVDGISFTNLSGELNIDLYENIVLQFNNRNIKPLFDGDNGLEPFTGDYVLSVFCYCFIEFLNYENLPFGSTPEERFKLGSYSFVTGYKNVVDSENNIISVPYRAAPSFINYPLFSLPPIGIVINPELPSTAVYEVSDAFEERQPTPVDLRFSFNLFTADRGVRAGCGINLNIAPGVTANMLALYGYTTVKQNLETNLQTYFYTL